MPGNSASLEVCAKRLYLRHYPLFVLLNFANNNLSKNERAIGRQSKDSNIYTLIK